MEDNHREKNVKIAALINTGFVVVEIAGGLWTNSLAILSDALHDLGDSITLIASWFAEKEAASGPDKKHTFGYQRLSLLSAFVSAIILVAGSVFIISRAVPRIINPEHVNASGMILFAVVGVVFNGFAYMRLEEGESLNEKVLSWHLMEDVLGWLVILIGGIVINIRDIHILDPIITLVFNGFILYGVGRNLMEIFNVFMQGVPEHIDLEKVEKDVKTIEGVKRLHDIHIWSLEGETDIFTGHVVVSEELLKNPDETRSKVKDVLGDHHIEHSTVELESPNFCSGMECENGYELDDSQ